MTSYTRSTLDLPVGALHSAFRFRFTNHASTGSFDDWFIDDVQLTSAGAGSPAQMVSFAVSYADGASEGFNDPTLGAQRKAAFECALRTWEGLMGQAYSGESITIDATTHLMGGTGTSATVGSAGPKTICRNYSGLLADNRYGAALANHLHGSDIDSSSAEISGRFNSDLDDATVLGTTDWHYGSESADRSLGGPRRVSLQHPVYSGWATCGSYT